MTLITSQTCHMSERNEYRCHNLYNCKDTGCCSLGEGSIAHYSMIRITVILSFETTRSSTNYITKLLTTYRCVSAITLMMLLLLGAAFTDSRRAVSSRSTSGTLSPLRRPDRIALGGMKSGAPSPHTPSSLDSDISKISWSGNQYYFTLYLDPRTSTSNS